MNLHPRPERIAEMRARMAEIGRAAVSFRDALRESNDERHQAFFAPVLDRIGLIVANEREGVTAHLADDLSVARSAVRRLALPDIDPDLDELTPALKLLRGERGNLVEALDNALDAASALGMEPGLVDFGQLRVQRNVFAEQLVRLDERLRVVQHAVTDLQKVAISADSAPRSFGFSQAGLVNIHVRSLKVDVSAARFETRIGDGPGVPEETDLTALARSIEAMRDLAGDLKEMVEGLGPWVAAGVRIAGESVTRAVERSWRGMRTVVSVVRRKLLHTRGVMAPEEIEVLAKAIHAYWLGSVEALGEEKSQLIDREWETLSDREWETLSEDAKADNLAAARRIPAVLARVGLGVTSAGRPKASGAVSAHLERHIELLAAAEHDGWLEFRKQNGWLYNKVRDDGMRLHPLLLPYSELPTEEAKNRARDTIRQIPKMVGLAGFRIVWLDDRA